MPITYQGDIVEEEIRPNLPRLPKIERRTRPKFILQCHADHWDWVWNDDDDLESGGEWLPRLSKLKMDPGINGVGLAADNKTILMQGALANAQAKGFRLVTNHDAKLAACLPNGSYLKSFPAVGGIAYACAWEEAHDVAGSVEWETNYPMFRAVQRTIKAEYLDGEPDPRWKRMKIRLQARAVSRLADRLAENPNRQGVKNRLDHARMTLEAWKADLEKHTKAGKAKGRKA